MGALALEGRVVRATDFAPLAAVPLRLYGPASAMARLPGVQPALRGKQITWTRQLSGFSGSRWDCWAAHVQRQVPHMRWEQFRDAVLLHNPSLDGDFLLKAERTYLLPEERAIAPYSWTRRLTGFAGSRWDCWTSHVQGRVEGLTWEQFRDDALLYNPQLNLDNRLFQIDRAYLIPQNDDTPQALLTTRSDVLGCYRFDLGDTPANYELQVELAGYARYVLPLAVNSVVSQPVALLPQVVASPEQPAPAASGSVRSARTDYAWLPDQARRLIDRALFMLGDDARVFDALPVDLRRMCYGSQFLSNPNSFHYKDIVCADLVSIALIGGGLNIGWGGVANPHMADYFHPDRGNPHLIEITNLVDWLPGDILVYGNGAPHNRAGHVNLYVGPFSGTDRSGRVYNLSDGMDVVEASIDFVAGGRETGTGVVGCPLGRCLQGKRGYAWVRHVRLRELAAAFAR